MLWMTKSVSGPFTSLYPTPNLAPVTSLSLSSLDLCPPCPFPLDLYVLLGASLILGASSHAVSHLSVLGSLLKAQRWDHSHSGRGYRGLAHLQKTPDQRICLSPGAVARELGCASHHCH